LALAQGVRRRNFRLDVMLGYVGKATDGDGDAHSPVAAAFKLFPPNAPIQQVQN